MPDLDINKSGFDGCYESLLALAGKLNGLKFELGDTLGDTSLAGEKERECMEALAQMAADLASLARETASDVKLTKARYVLADKS